MTTSLEPGDVIKGKYTVERVIGEGGMGVVLAAFHSELESHVAIKVLNPDVMENPQVVERFEREARSAVKIKSRHVARVTDVGKLLGGRPYMVMEYLEGLDLEAVMLKEEQLPIVIAVDYVLQACDAIAEAHSYGIVHRDLKPGNLFLAVQPDGSKEIKVLDFGISKSTNPQAPEKGITSATEIFGSAMYMSPEQLTASANVDGRADIWSLGVILYELLTGTPPFHEGTVAEIWSGILHKEIEKPTKRRASIPAGLEKAIMKALTRDLDKRYQHIADFAEEIAAFGTGDHLVCVDRAVRFRNRSNIGGESGQYRLPGAPAAEGRAAMASLINVDIDWDDAPPAAAAKPADAPAATSATATPKPRPKSMRPPSNPSLGRSGQTPVPRVPDSAAKARTTTDWQSVAPPKKRPVWPMIAIAGAVAVAVVVTIVLLNARTSSNSNATNGKPTDTAPTTKPTSDMATLVESPRDTASAAPSSSAKPRYTGRLPTTKPSAKASSSAAPSAAPPVTAPEPSAGPPTGDDGAPDEPAPEPQPAPPPT